VISCILKGAVKEFPELFEINGLMHHEFVVPGNSVTVQVLQRKWQARTVVSAPSHSACCVITQPPYSPDLAPSDFWLFPTLKMGLKGTHFATMEAIK
jgi:hypothetical protein